SEAELGAGPECGSRSPRRAPPVTASPPVGVNMASSNSPPLGALEAATTGNASPPGSPTVEMKSPPKRPWVLLASHDRVIGPVTSVAVLQVLPPLVEEM